MIEQGAVFWLELGRRSESSPAGRRPVLVIQSDAFNASRIATVVVAALTSNLDLARFPGNVMLPANASKLPKPSVVNVTALATVDKAELVDYAGTIDSDLLEEVRRGVSLALGS